MPISGLAQDCNRYQPNLLPFLSILHQLSRIASRMPCVSNQILAVLHHVSVGPDDGGPLRHSLHPRRVECAIETGRCWSRAVIRMIRQQQSERHLRVALLCCFDAFCRQCIKAAISAYDKISHTMFSNMPLHLSVKNWQQTVWGLSAPDKKAGSHKAEVTAACRGRGRRGRSPPRMPCGCSGPPSLCPCPVRRTMRQ